MIFQKEDLKNCTAAQLKKGEFEYNNVVYTHAFLLVVDQCEDAGTVVECVSEGFKINNGKYTLYERPRFAIQSEILVFGRDKRGVLFVKPFEDDQDW